MHLQGRRVSLTVALRRGGENSATHPVASHVQRRKKTQQWNEETRRELTTKLLKELNLFTETKDLHKETILNRDKRELVLPNHEFTRGKIVTSR